jgi:hypothetical protein
MSVESDVATLQAQVLAMQSLIRDLQLCVDLEAAEHRGVNPEVIRRVRTLLAS